MDQTGHSKKVYKCSPSIHSQYCPKTALHPSCGLKDHQIEHHIVQNYAVGLPSVDLQTKIRHFQSSDNNRLHIASLADYAQCHAPKTANQ